ncbi:Spindle pole body-associated protein sad1 [Hypsizygus marmoreus]|uniref:Spindle pole body-associated protein sad1 n=1 Tax=Hypsizygus marmoreus TaxID=39966 RepID=A0A369JZR3_HYPMA|nr:Spindle pole body-associated protein sad1 [Hypsizygus marmoreus]
MSFSSTPLGQGRRLDHGTFLNKPPSNGNRPPSPNRLVPTSYAYGASTLGSRSPPKPSSPSRDRNLTHHEDDENNDSALAAFARTKQREQAAVLSRPGGPKVITSPPHNPERWSVKDTSVNIASAFHQAAATDMNTAHNPNNSWASGSTRPNAAIPRSTSVEYEKEAQAAMQKRLGAPQSRLAPRNPAARKPISKSASLRHVPDSEEEGPDGRGKSPFEQLVDSAKRVIGPASYYLQQRLPADLSTNAKDSSYDYAAEEQEYQNSQASRRTANHKRNRMSTDNKAYKPTLSDQDVSDEDFSDDDGKKRRRKKKKKEPTGGPLQSLPVIAADKRKRRRAKGNKGSKGGDGEEEEEEQSGSGSDDATEHHSAQRASIPRNSVPPPIRQQSIARSSVPRELPDDNEPDTSLDVEQGLDSIPEVDEDQLYDARHDMRRSTSRPPSHIGGPLGYIVHWLARVVKAIAFFVVQILVTILYVSGKILGTIFDIVLRRPILWASGASPGSQFFSSVMKCVLLGLILTGGYMLREPLLQYIPSPSSRPVYHAPDVPAANIAELAARLQRIENALSGISQEAEKGRLKVENEAKSYSDLVGRLGSLESKVLTESKKAADAEVQFRNVAQEGLKVRQEVEVLQAQVQQQQQHPSKGEISASDEEARAKVKALEDRVGSVEGGVKEALELGKKASSGVGAAWWNKLASGSAAKSGLTIKSSDGQDVTSLIGHLVDSAVSTYSKDTLARPDFALHSGGARVIPSLTSPTFEMRPANLRSQLVGLITGNGYAIGRPPVHALHYDLHNGDCWPFAGSEGQLGVALAAPTYISDITIDHVAREVAFDMRTAPRQMEVWAMVEGKDNIAKVKEWMAEKERRRVEAKERGDEVEEEPAYPKTLPKTPQYIRIANFTYNIYAPKNIQTFPVSQEIRDLGVDFGIVVLRIKSNWGREEYTCLYRLRVHGERMGETPLPYPEEVA